MKGSLKFEDDPLRASGIFNDVAHVKPIQSKAIERKGLADFEDDVSNMSIGTKKTDLFGGGSKVKPSVFGDMEETTTNSGVSISASAAKSAANLEDFLKKADEASRANLEAHQKRLKAREPASEKLQAGPAAVLPSTPADSVVTALSNLKEPVPVKPTSAEPQAKPEPKPAVVPEVKPVVSMEQPAALEADLFTQAPSNAHVPQAGPGSGRLASALPAKSSLFNDDADDTSAEARGLENVFIPEGAMERRLAPAEHRAVDKDLLDVRTADLEKFEKRAPPRVPQPATVKEVAGVLDDDLFGAMH